MAGGGGGGAVEDGGAVDGGRELVNGRGSGVVAVVVLAGVAGGVSGGGECVGGDGGAEIGGLVEVGDGDVGSDEVLSTEVVGTGVAEVVGPGGGKVEDGADDVAAVDVAAGLVVGIVDETAAVVDGGVVVLPAVVDTGVVEDDADDDVVVLRSNALHFDDAVRRMQARSTYGIGVGVCGLEVAVGVLDCAAVVVAGPNELDDVSEKEVLETVDV